MPTLALILLLSVAAPLICRASSLGVPPARRPEGVGASEKLTAQQLRNLVAFAKLYGYVRYFHPSDQSSRVDWNQFAVFGVENIARVTGNQDLIRQLGRLFQPIAPTLRVLPKPSSTVSVFNSIRSNAALSAKYLAWVHRGPDVGNPYHYLSERVNRDAFPVEATFPDPTRPFVADLAPGIQCVMPLSLPVDSTGTLPHQGSVSTLLLTVDSNRSAYQWKTRVADVIVAWNILQHFYPYFDVLKSDWSSVLPRSIAMTASDTSIEAHRKTMRWIQDMVADGHGVASGFRDARYAKNFRYWWIPLKVEWIEGKLVVEKVTPGADSSVHRGDIITAINGRSPASHLKQLESSIPGSPQMKRWWSVRYLPRLLEDSITLVFTTPTKKSKEVTFHRFVEPTNTSSVASPPSQQPEEVREGIFYIDAEWFTYDAFKGFVTSHLDAKGLIIDIRAYPNNLPEQFLGHLTDVPVSVPNYSMPLVTRPDRTDMKFTRSQPRVIQPQTPRIHAKVVFLSGPRAISYAEHLLSIVQHHKLGQIVGEPTAGTNGNINWCALPSGYDFVWTAMRVLRYDGSQFHGIGVQPDFLVRRSMRAFVNQRDDALDRAMELINH